MVLIPFESLPANIDYRELELESRLNESDYFKCVSNRFGENVKADYPIHIIILDFRS